MKTIQQYIIDHNENAALNIFKFIILILYNIKIYLYNSIFFFLNSDVIFESNFLNIIYIKKDYLKFFENMNNLT